MPLDPNAPKITSLVRDVCARVADKVWKAPTDGDGPLIDLLRKNAIKAKEAKFPLHYVSKDMVSSEPYGAAEVCLHSFAYDTGVCMSCGMSEASVRAAASEKAARGLPKDDVGIPYDPSAWAKLAESLDQREAALKESQDFLKRQGVPGVEITPTLEVAALTILHGSREKALDAWKAAHLDDRAKRNANSNPPTPPKPGEAEAREKRYQARRVEIDRRDALAAAMSRPIAAEKSMRAQLLLREDD